MKKNKDGNDSRDQILKAGNQLGDVKKRCWHIWVSYKKLLNKSKQTSV